MASISTCRELWLGVNDEKEVIVVAEPEPQPQPQPQLQPQPQTESDEELSETDSDPDYMNAMHRELYGYPVATTFEPEIPL